VTHVTPFAEMANPAPRYGGLVPPFYDRKKMELPDDYVYLQVSSKQSKTKKQNLSWRSLKFLKE